MEQNEIDRIGAYIARHAVPMTQPISPDEGDALKALMWKCPHLSHEPSGICLGCGEQHEPLQSWLDAQDTRTDPPAAMDEVELLAKEFEKVDGYRGDIHRTLARIALTRIKDSGNG